MPRKRADKVIFPRFLRGREVEGFCFSWKYQPRGRNDFRDIRNVTSFHGGRVILQHSVSLGTHPGEGAGLADDNIVRHGIRVLKHDPDTLAGRDGDDVFYV